MSWEPPVLRADGDVVRISPQEANVLSGLCCGQTYDQICKKLNITRNTLVTHVKRLYVKLDAKCATHAVALACSGQVTVVVSDSRRQAPRPWERAS